MQPQSEPPAKDADFEMGADIRNSVFVGGGTGFDVVPSPYLVSFVNTYNNLFGMPLLYNNAASQGVGEISVDPEFDLSTPTYGKGAYLIAPAALASAGEGGSPMGAEILYRMENGELTSTPLWPWPMEDRILREAGASVTWESQGGLWQTLSGVYP